MTPSLSGRTATMLPGVRPIIRLASMPTATIWPLLVLRATTDGSLSTIPRPRTYTRVLAVPRSTPMSRPTNEDSWAGTEPVVEPLGFGRVGVIAIAATSEVDGTQVRSSDRIGQCEDSQPPWRKPGTARGLTAESAAPDWCRHTRR